MSRFEDQGLTLRLFKDEHDAKAHSDSVSVARYGPGVIGKNTHGQWIDAQGVLPSEWVPSAKMLVVPEKYGYYVNVNGAVCCADVAPRGCHFSFHDKKAYREVWIVSDRDGEVIEEYVLWPSLTAMAAGGVDLKQERALA